MKRGEKKPFMRIALDNSYLIESGEQDTFVDYDDAGRLMTSGIIEEG